MARWDSPAREGQSRSPETVNFGSDAAATATAVPATTTTCPGLPSTSYTARVGQRESAVGNRQTRRVAAAGGRGGDPAEKRMDASMGCSVSDVEAAPAGLLTRTLKQVADKMLHTVGGT